MITEKLVSMLTHNGLVEQLSISPSTPLALILRSSFQREGIEFFTPGSYSQQLGYMKRLRGYQIQPHLHHPITREVQYTNEVLFIKSGRVKVNFYSTCKIFIGHRILNAGDIILLIEGGHGFEMLEDSEIIEIKQGPYANEMDKEKF